METHKDDCELPLVLTEVHPGVHLVLFEVDSGLQLVLIQRFIQDCIIHFMVSLTKIIYMQFQFIETKFIISLSFYTCSCFYIYLFILNFYLYILSSICFSVQLTVLCIKNLFLCSTNNLYKQYSTVYWIVCLGSF